MRWIRGAAAIAVIVGVLVGVPWLLFNFADPRRLILVDWFAAFSGPDDGAILLPLLGLVGLMAWLLLSASLLAEFFTVLTGGRFSLHIPGTAWLRPFVSALVAAAFFSLSAAAAAAPSDQPTPNSTNQVVTDQSAPETGRSYLVQLGDELWDIADSQLGSGERWRDIITMNPGLSSHSKLSAGLRLNLPPDVVVGKGDSLWQLAARHLGAGERWVEIFELNADLIDDPNELEIGWRLLLPSPNQSDSTTERNTREPVKQSQKNSSRATRADRLAAVTVPEHDDVARSDSSNNPEPKPIKDAEVSGSTSNQHADVTRPIESPPEPAREENPSGVSDNSPVEHHARKSTPGRKKKSDHQHDDLPMLGTLGGLLASSIVVGVTARRRSQLVSRGIGRQLVPFPPNMSEFWAQLTKRATLGRSKTSPTTVVLGWHADNSEALLDLEQTRITSLLTDEPDEIIGALLTSLLCAPWSEQTEVLLVEAPEDWSGALDDPRLIQLPDADQGVAELLKICARRRVALGTRLLTEARSDPDQAPDWPPLVALFSRPLSAHLQRKIAEALSFGEVGVSVVAPRLADGQKISFSGNTARLADVAFRPQLITAPARRALVDLFHSCSTTNTNAAWWWSAPKRAIDQQSASIHSPARHSTAQGAADPDKPTDLVPATTQETVSFPPRLLLFGEPKLLYPHGEPPTRALQQCVEYCAWLLTHPGSTAAMMTRGLCIAEGTRRSNLSRLRNWLGEDKQGNRFLPEAYNGRIQLDGRVTSDWLQMKSLLATGVNQVSTPTLRSVLDLVQGPPLGLAARRWLWARNLYDEMVSLTLDLCCEYADRALTSGASDEAVRVLELAEQICPGNDEVGIRIIKALSRCHDKQATTKAIDSFLGTLRADNREVRYEHSLIIAQVERSAAG